MGRIIREQEPPRPSTRLSTLADAELTAVAGHRRAEPPKLISLVRGDLDWIVMKALEKDRTRRYPSHCQLNGASTAPALRCLGQKGCSHLLKAEAVLVWGVGKFVNQPSSTILLRKTIGEIPKVDFCLTDSSPAGQTVNNE
jgi:hypothetical protein